MPSDFGEHIRLMYDLLAVAFQTDSTRVASFVVANEGSNRSYPMIGVNDGHHEVSHHGGDKTKQEKIAKINRFHIEQFGRFLGKLRSIKEGEGTLLDHSLIVYGSCIADGNSHAHDNLPILVAGHGSGTIQLWPPYRLSQKDAAQRSLAVALGPHERQGRPPRRQRRPPAAIGWLSDRGEQNPHPLRFRQRQYGGDGADGGRRGPNNSADGSASAQRR